VTLPVGVLKAAHPALGAVRFVPRLREKERALARLEPGAIVKLLLRFRTPFWEELQARHRFVFFTAPGHPIPTWWTLAPRRSRHLVGWSGGPAARALSLLDSQSVLRTGLETLGRIFRLPLETLAAQLESWHVRSWPSEPFSLGGYCVVTAGALDAPRALAAPVQDTLFFAGEATHLEGQLGTVHGALETGLRAAHEVLALERPSARHAVERHRGDRRLEEELGASLH
jgi:monoamine oxidase